MIPIRNGRRSQPRSQPPRRCDRKLLTSSPTCWDTPPSPLHSSPWHRMTCGSTASTFHKHLHTSGCPQILAAITVGPLADSTFFRARSLRMAYPRTRSAHTPSIKGWGGVVVLHFGEQQPPPLCCSTPPLFLEHQPPPCSSSLPIEPNNKPPPPVLLPLPWSRTTTLPPPLVVVPPPPCPPQTLAPPANNNPPLFLFPFQGVEQPPPPCCGQWLPIQYP